MIYSSSPHYHWITIEAAEKPVDILVVDDHPIIHVTLAAVAHEVLPDAQIHSETSLSGALEQVQKLQDLELVLLDLGLPGCSGIDALMRMQAAAPGVRVVVVSATEDPTTVEAAIKAGAVGYIPKTTPPPQMIAALKLVLSGATYLPTQVMNPGPAPQPRGKKEVTLAELGLTDRQVDVLRLLLKGDAYREIARQLKIAESTVKQHCHSLYRTLGVNSRTEAIIALARKGIRLD